MEAVFFMTKNLIAPRARDFTIYYKDGTLDILNTAYLVDWNEEFPDGFKYVDSFPQHLSKVMKNRGVLFIVRPRRESEETKCALPVSLDKIIDTSFVKKIEISR